MHLLDTFIIIMDQLPSLLRAAAFFILSLLGKRIVSPEDPPLS